MAIDQLSLYNDALLLLGRRKLSSISENREPRHVLDDVYNLEAIRYCLEISEPVFARKTTALTSSVTSSEHDFDNVFTLPSDYVTKVDVYIDANLDRPLKRYIIEGGTIACNYSTIYLRYISDGYALTAWSPAFTRLVAAYLAREAAERLAPGKYDSIDAKFVDRIDVVKNLNSKEDPIERPNKFTTTMTNTWRYIYNDALLILGLDTLTTNDDDSERRAKLDDAFNADLVKYILEDTSWIFGLESTRSQYDPSLEPEFGYTRVHGYPTNLHTLHGVYTDEYMREPLKYYIDEGDYFFCDLDTIYVQYVSDDFVSNPDVWPSHFKKLVAARLAKEAAASLARGMPVGEKRLMIDRADAEYKERKYTAMSIDTMSAPPRILTTGNWVKSRYKQTNGNRPGDS